MKIFLSISWLLIIVSIPPVNKNLGEYCLLGHQRPPPAHNHFLPYNTQQIQIQISEPSLYHTTNTNTRIKYQTSILCTVQQHITQSRSEFCSPAVPKFWRRNEVIVWNLLIIHKKFRTSTLFYTPNANENTSTNRFMYNLGIRAHQYHKLFKNNYRVHYKVSVTVQSIAIYSCEQATSIADNVF